jgi:hypothetical protein
MPDLASAMVALLLLMTPPVTFASPLQGTLVQHRQSSLDDLGDKQAPLWEGPLFCANAEMPGILMIGAICGKSSPACNMNLDGQRGAFSALMRGNATFTECKPHEPDMVRVYCFSGSGETVCSGSQLTCEALRKRSSTPMDVNGRACIQYLLE